MLYSVYEPTQATTNVFSMINWIVRILLLLAGVITSWFATPDSANFSLVQAGVAIVLLAFFVSAAVFLPSLRRLFSGKSSPADR
jgi:ABC-type uncharacterized transport system permease subunit